MKNLEKIQNFQLLLLDTGLVAGADRLPEIATRTDRAENVTVVVRILDVNNGLFSKRKSKFSADSNILLNALR